MNIKKLLTISILLIFVFGMIVGAADAAHTVKKGKYKAKLTNKEYKKLTMTQIKYKTVTKTRRVEKTKTKEVEVTKKEYYNLTHTELYRKHYNKKNGTSTTGYFHWDDRPASKYYYSFNKSVNYDYTFKNSTYHIYKEEYGKYNTTELRTWTEWEPRKYKVNVTEKYSVKVPYKVRVRAEVQKTVGYIKSKEDKVVGHKYKTVYKYRTVKLTVVYNPKTDTWTNNFGVVKKYSPKILWKSVKTIKQIKPNGIFIYTNVIKSKNKLPVKTKIPIIKKVTVKEPIYMTISTMTMNTGNDRCLPGKKVLVTIWSSWGPIASDTVNIK